MAFSKAKLKSNGDKASLFSKTFLIGSLKKGPVTYNYLARYLFNHFVNFLYRILFNNLYSII